MRRLVFLLGVLFALSAWAQPYPGKPVRLIVGFPPAARRTSSAARSRKAWRASWASPWWWRTLPASAACSASSARQKPPPDGYTLCINSASPLVIAPYSLSKIPYDVKKDFAFITLVVRVPEVLAVHPSLPANSLAELISYAKANPGKVNFGSAGSGSITHLAGELLKAEAKVDLVHVPYKGAAPAVNDLLGGQVQMGIFDVPVLLGHIRSGKLKALARQATSARVRSRGGHYGRSSAIPTSFRITGTAC